MDWSEKDLCIKCNEGGNLLVCSENGCPLAVHEGCMRCPARFDDSGHFYCPYCLYKQAVAESRRAREYALARKKALLIFMDEKATGSEKHIEEDQTAEDNGHNETKNSEENAKIITCDDGKTKSNSDAIPDQPIQLDDEHKTSNSEEDKIQKEESESSSGSKGHDPSLKLHEVQTISDEEEKKYQEEEHETSAASSGQDPSLRMQEDKICNAEEEEEKIQEEECETTSVSTSDDLPLSVRARAKRGSRRTKPVDQDTGAVPVKSTLRKQLDKNKQTSPNTPRRSSRRSSSAPKTEKVSNEVVGASKRLKQPEQPSVKLASDAFGSGKRKRLLWREDEEKMLKAGVEKFSKEANKNLPWRKILDLGHRVFDATRTPGDLKDKWRNMSAK